MKIVVACIASVSARVRRESWDESKKKRNEGGEGSSRSNFRAITRLETLATQAKIVVTLLNICYCNNYLIGILSRDEINCLNLFVVEKFVNSRADGLAAFSMS